MNEAPRVKRCSRVYGRVTVPCDVENFFVETRESCVTFNDRTRRETAKPGSSPLQTPLKFAGADADADTDTRARYAGPKFERAKNERGNRGSTTGDGFLCFRGERDTRRGMNEWRGRTRGGCEKSCTRGTVPVAIGRGAGVAACYPETRDARCRRGASARKQPVAWTYSSRRCHAARARRDEPSELFFSSVRLRARR